MRLLTKTSLYFLLAMVPLLVAGGFYLYYQFNRETDREMDQELIYDEVRWINYVQQVGENSGPFILRTPELLIYPVNAMPADFPTIVDSRDFEESLNRKLPYRQLSQVVDVNGVPYQIVIRRSQLQKSVLLGNITRIMSLVFAGLFIITMLFNGLISQRLWKPFRHSLEKIRGAGLGKMEAVQFEKTSVEEFNELNVALKSMANKIHEDYLNMKEFTEDAAHEMQTPLAIAHGKMELLLQDSDLSDTQATLVMQTNEALKRLSRTNQSLLLLAKIENHQYEATQKLSLTQIIGKYLASFDEIIRDKHIRVETSFDEEFTISLHPLLAESLVSNLVGNAIKYNYSGGKISIRTTDQTFSIANTSSLPPIKQEQLFKRFSKAATASDISTGLGLAIVKKIADTHRLAIHYEPSEGLQQFVVEKK